MKTGLEGTYGTVNIDDSLDASSEVEIWIDDDDGLVCGIFINKDNAQEIIKHLTEVFELNNEQGE